MAKYRLSPNSELDRLVREFLARKGIDPTDVLDYEIVRGHDIAKIRLTMVYDEGPARTETTGLDRATPEYLPTVTADNPNIAKEG